MNIPDIKKFLDEKKIIPKNIQFYKDATTHSTFSNENKTFNSYEMLEWLGDSIIQAKSSIIIFNHFQKSNMTPGKATTIRSINVKNNMLAKITKSLGLNKYLLCSNNKEELINNQDICADLFESFVGALYLDLGDSAVDTFLNKYLAPKIKLTDTDNLKDFKTKFQELIQLTSTSPITYISKKTPKHMFSVKLMHEAKCYGVGIGKTKKEGENLAAKFALDILAKGKTFK